jgi:hypothetical protein
MVEIEARTNIRDFNAELRDLGGRVTKRVVKNAIAAAGRVILPIARSLAPVLKTRSKYRIPGTLKAGIYQQRVRPIPGGLSTGISVRSPRAAKFTKRAGIQTPFYWRFLEGGWNWKARGKGVKTLARTGEKRQSRKSKIAGGRKQFPFLAPALKEGTPAALRKFEEIMDKGIAREQQKRGASV